MRSPIQRYPWQRSVWRVCLLSVLILGFMAVVAEAQVLSENEGGPVATACSTTGTETGTGTSSTASCTGASVELVGIPGQCSQLTEEEKESQSCADVSFDEAIEQANGDCGEGCKCNNLRVNGPTVDCFQAGDTCYCTCSKSVSGTCSSASVSTTFAKKEVPSFLIPEAAAVCTLAQMQASDEERAL